MQDRFDQEAIDRKLAERFAKGDIEKLTTSRTLNLGESPQSSTRTTATGRLSSRSPGGGRGGDDASEA